MKEQLEQMWTVKSRVLPMVVDALGTVMPKLGPLNARYNIWGYCPEESSQSSGSYDTEPAKSQGLHLMNFIYCLHTHIHIHKKSTHPLIK